MLAASVIFGIAEAFRFLGIEGNVEALLQAIADLAVQNSRQLRHIRVSAQHADARHKAVTAFREIGLPFPPPTWGYAWGHIVALAVGALNVLREEVHAGLQ